MAASCPSTAAQAAEGHSVWVHEEQGFTHLCALDLSVETHAAGLCVPLPPSKNPQEEVKNHRLAANLGGPTPNPLCMTHKSLAETPASVLALSQMPPTYFLLYPCFCCSFPWKAFLCRFHPVQTAQIAQRGKLWLGSDFLAQQPCPVSCATLAKSLPLRPSSRLSLLAGRRGGTQGYSTTELHDTVLLTCPG